MPRPRPVSPGLHLNVEVLVRSITTLVESVKEAASSAVEGVAEVAAAKPAAKRGPGKGNPKLKAALRAYWKRMKGDARKARVAKMLRGRGVKTRK